MSLATSPAGVFALVGTALLALAGIGDHYDNNNGGK